MSRCLSRECEFGAYHSWTLLQLKRHHSPEKSPVSTKQSACRRKGSSKCYDGILTIRKETWRVNHSFTQISPLLCWTVDSPSWSDRENGKNKGLLDVKCVICEIVLPSSSQASRKTKQGTPFSLFLLLVISMKSSSRQQNFYEKVHLVR